MKIYVEIAAGGQNRIGETLKGLARTLTDLQVRHAADDWAIFDLDPEIQKNLAGKILHRRSGNLATRTRVKLREASRQDVVVSVTAYDAPYAAAQEFGATIKPVHAKALTIPLPAAMTPAGVLRHGAGWYRTNPAWRTWIVPKGLGGNGTILGQQGKNGPIVALFLLRQQVIIPATHWATKSIEDTLPKLRQRLINAVQGIFEARGGGTK